MKIFNLSLIDIGSLKLFPIIKCISGLCDSGFNLVLITSIFFYDSSQLSVWRELLQFNSINIITRWSSVFSLFQLHQSRFMYINPHPKLSAFCIQSVYHSLKFLKYFVNQLFIFSIVDGHNSLTIDFWSPHYLFDFLGNSSSYITEPLGDNEYSCWTPSWILHSVLVIYLSTFIFTRLFLEGIVFC